MDCEVCSGITFYAHFKQQQSKPPKYLCLGITSYADVILGDDPNLAEERLVLISAGKTILFPDIPPCRKPITLSGISVSHQFDSEFEGLSIPRIPQLNSENFEKLVNKCHEEARNLSEVMKEEFEPMVDRARTVTDDIRNNGVDIIKKMPQEMYPHIVKAKEVLETGVKEILEKFNGRGK